MRDKILSFLGSVGVVLLGAVFTLAAFSKIGDLLGFAQAVDSISFLPAWMKGVAVLWVPGLELTLGLCLLCRMQLPETLLAACGLLLAFLALGVVSNLLGHPESCSCFKLHKKLEWKVEGWWIVGRNCLLLALASFCLWQSRKKT